MCVLQSSVTSYHCTHISQKIAKSIGHEYDYGHLWLCISKGHT